MMQDIVDYYDTGKTDQVQIIYTSFYAPQKNMPVNPPAASPFA